MTYEDILARHGQITAGDLLAAKSFLGTLDSYLALSSGALTPARRNYLYTLRKRWRARADGLDLRWSTHGSKPGRKKRASLEPKQAHVDPTAFGAEDEMDPLLASLVRKFGAPRRTDDI